MIKSIKKEQEQMKNILTNLSEPMDILVIKSVFKNIEGKNPIITNLIDEKVLFLKDSTLYSRKYLISIGEEVASLEDKAKLNGKINMNIDIEKTNKDINQTIKIYEKKHNQSLENANYIISD